MKYKILYNFFVFLLVSHIRAEFPVDSDARNKDAYPTEEIISENIPNRIKEDRAVHESYRSRHKYKVGTGHQGTLRRIIRSTNDGPQCAVMYKNNEPVGILQPYEDSYRFLPVKGEPTIVDINPIPIQRKSIIDVLYPSEINDDDGAKVKDNTVGFADDAYPSVFAKFRIDTKLAKSRSPENYMKRSMFKREQPRESFDSKTDMDDVAVEGQLKTILDDMGLIEDYPSQEVKRAIEDENLELGTNKINLFKEDHTESRERRYDLNTPGVPLEVSSKTTVKLAEASARQVSDTSGDDDENIIDKLQQNSEANEKTVVDDPVDEENSPYEARIERAIRDKIHKLKEEVKKEIDKLRGKGEGKKDAKKGGKKQDKKDERGDGEEEEMSDEKKEDTRRKKRQTLNTLLNEENKDIDPLSFNNDDEQIHVRRKRDLATSNSNLNGLKFKSRSLKQFEENYMEELVDSSKNENGDDSEYESMKDNAEFDEDARISEEDSSRKSEYEYDESELNDDSELNEVAENAMNDDTRSRNTYDKDTCNCDKNNNECKCNIPSLIDRQPSKSQEIVNAQAETTPVTSSGEHCSCSKNGNCKCTRSLKNDVDSSGIKTQEVKSDTQVTTDNQHRHDCKNNNCMSQLQPLIYQETKDKNNILSDQAMKPREEAIGDFQNGEYFVDFHPDRYRFSSGEISRNKRENFEDMVAAHGGDVVKEHIAAIRERSMLPPARDRSIRRVHREENDAPRQLIDMSEEDIFGALPQGFVGGLQRYKRVKRT